MKPYYKLLDLRAFMTAFGALLLLASCSSYQYAGYDNDGIYSSSENDEAYTANDYEESYEEALYYKKLFSEKADEFANVPQEGAIFTDVENYSSTGAYDENMFLEEGLDYQTGNAAWGSNPDRISIYIHQDPFRSPIYSLYMHPFYTGFYDPFFMPGHGYAYSPYGFGYGFGYGYGYRPWFNRWGYGYNRIGWGGYGRYGYGYGYNQYPYYYGPNRYYGRNYREVAYSNSRRDNYMSNDRLIRSNNNQARANRIERYSNTRNLRAARGDYSDRTYSTRSTRVRSSANRSTTRRSSAYNRSSNREGTYNRSNNTRQVRSVRNTRSYNENTRVRSTRSSSNNNRTYRSSTSSSRSRSSGNTGSSTSRSSRGRGN